MKSKSCAPVVEIFSLALGLLLLLPQAPASAQTVTATVPVGTSPVDAAVNPVTNKTYVANSANKNVTVIDGATNSTTAVPAGIGPIAVAVNSVTNKIYVANRGAWLKNIKGSVTLIDGATNSTTTVTDSNATFPSAVAVNPVTNKIYVTNSSHNVTVIDGDTNSTTTVTDPNAAFPVAVAVNSVTNKIYVANVNSGNVTVIDGATNSTTTVPVTGTSALGPVALAVNPLTNKIYVANNGVIRLSTNVGNVTVIDGATNSTTTVTDPNAITPVAVAVNPSTNKIYVTNVGNFPGSNHGNVTVIDGATNSTTTVTDPNALAPLGVAVDPVTNKIYVTNGNSSALSGNGGVTVIDGATNSTTTVTDPNAKTDIPAAVAVDSATDKIYVANVITSNVTVIDGGTGLPADFTLSVTPAGNGSGTVTSNPAGVECPSSCFASFAAGTMVTLTATSASGSAFAGWSGACSGTGACGVTMNAAESVTATFNSTPPPDFSLSPGSAKLTVQRGGQGTDTITIAALNGPFGSAVQLTCRVSGPSPMPTCAFSPTSLTPGANSGISTLTITVPAATAMQLPSSRSQLGKFLYAVWLPLMFGITVLGGLRKQRSHHWAVCGFLALLLLSQVACGGGNRPTNYTVTVTGASGTITHTAQVTVTVQ